MINNVIKWIGIKKYGFFPRVSICTIRKKVFYSFEHLKRRPNPDIFFIIVDGFNYYIYNII